MALTHRFTRGALRVDQNGAEALVIHADGRIVTRSITVEGRLHVQEQRCLRLLKWLLGLQAEHQRLIISAEPLPASLLDDFSIRSVFAFFPGEEHHHPVLLTREPLQPEQICRLLRAFPPVTAIVNAGVVHIPPAARKRARGL